MRKFLLDTMSSFLVNLLAMMVIAVPTTVLVASQEKLLAVAQAMSVFLTKLFASLHQAALALLTMLSASWNDRTRTLTVIFAIVLAGEIGIWSLLKRPYSQLRYQEIISRLNKNFEETAIIYSIKKHDPIVHTEGKYDVSSIHKERILKFRQYLQNGGIYNDMHAVVIKEPNWNEEPITVQVKNLEYAAAMALREDARLNSRTPGPMLLTANVLLICADDGKIILLRRSSDLATNPGKLDVFGGGYMPVHDPDDDLGADYQRKDYDANLRQTAERILMEESGIFSTIPNNAIRFLSRNKINGNIQLTYIVCDISKSTLDRARAERFRMNSRHNWRDIVKELAFDNLDKVLCEEELSPTGKMSILLWLALGAPGYGGKFGKLSARKLFNKHVK